MVSQLTEHSSQIMPKTGCAPLPAASCTRSGRDRAHATFWPYPADVAYFKAMAALSSICAFTVFAIEAYAIW